MSEPIHIISLGAGVQSSTMALMAAHELITPMPTAAIFADTAAEPRKVYEWLDWLETQLPFPVIRVMKNDDERGLRGNILDAIEGGRFAGAPFFTESDTARGEGRLRRQCTREFKIDPIKQAVRRMLGLGKGERAPKRIMAVTWIGISTDELAGMAVSRHDRHDYPAVRQAVDRPAQGVRHIDVERRANVFERCALGHFRPGVARLPQLQKVADLVAPIILANLECLSPFSNVVEHLRVSFKFVFSHVFVLCLPVFVGSRLTHHNAEDAGQISLFDDECEGMCGV